MNNGILLALLAYAVYSWSDAAVKGLGGGLTVFEIGFYAALLSSACMVLATFRSENWLQFWRMRRPWGVQARALSGATASVLGVIAFTSIPLAEVYALIFLAPLFVTILSVIFLKEHVGPWRWMAVVIGFAGVLLVVRPGFRELEFGHLAALFIALLAAISIILMRSLSAHETRATMLGYLMLYVLLFNGAAMAVTSAELPNGHELSLLLVTGVFGAVGNILILRATRLSPASHLAPAHYSQIIWAVVIGALIFEEQPDLITLLGLAVIVGSGLLTLAREKIRLGTVRWNPFGRNRL